MADLHSLIRVRTHAVEQKQKALADLYDQVEGLEKEKTTLLYDLEQEGKKLAQDNMAGMQGYYSNYAKRVRLRTEQIDEEILKLESRIEVARDDIQTAFADLKKIEITQAEREKEERAMQDKKESEMLDEIALEGYRRRLDEGGHEDETQEEL